MAYLANTMRFLPPISIAEDPNLRPLMDTMAAHWPTDQPVPSQPADPESVGESGDDAVENVDPPGDEPVDESAVEEPPVEPVYDVEELRLQREAVV